MKQAGIVIACALAAALAAPAALAQERAPRLGVVDMERLLDEYQEFQDSDAEFNLFVRQREAEFAERRALRLLTQEELKEWDNLKAVVAPSPEQKRRAEQLKAVAEARDNELRALQVQSQPTEDDQQRLAELQAMAQQNDAQLQALRERMSREIEERNKDISERLNHKIESTLAGVAREKRVDFVLSKHIVLWGGTDLTDDVLAKLNAPAPAP